MIRTKAKFIATAHQKIAFVAWSQRPMGWFDPEVEKILAEATLKEPVAVRNVAFVAGTMGKADPTSKFSFAIELMQQWQKAEVESRQLETRKLCELTSTLSATCGRNLVEPMRKTLVARTNRKDGWLAASQLWYISSDDAKLRSFPEDIDLNSLIKLADFSVAPSRATHFFQQVGGRTELLNVIYQKLFESLERRLEWKIDPTLLVWLISHAPKADVVNRVSHIAEWLKDHDDDTSVRTQYLTFLQGLPPAFDEQRKQAVAEIAEWLKSHDDDTCVRTQYLRFVQGLPEDFDKERCKAVQATADWLERHPGTYDVLGGYVSMLLEISDASLEPLRQKSDKHHQRIIEMNPADPGHNFIYAEQLLRLSRFDEAIAQYDVVLTRNDGHQLAWRGRAIALQNMGRMPEAETEFKHALWLACKKNQFQAMFHTSLGKFYLETKRWLEAIKSFQQASNECPDYFGNYWGIAKAHVGLGNFEKADAALQQALKDPKLKPHARDEIVQYHADIRVRRTS